MKGIVPGWMKYVADAILPRICSVCGRRLLMRENHICLSCLADMPLTRFWKMEHNPMADKFNEVIQRSLVIYDNPPVPREHYAYAAALFIYREDGEYRRITHQLKYHGNIRLGRYFGSMLGHNLSSGGMFDDVDLVIPVPLHWTRKWKRGYNQAEVIASEIAKSLRADMNTDILSRTKRTKTQTQLDLKQKNENVTGAFAVSSRKLSSNIRHILLVDDVFTTGSTVVACFTALRTVFPPSVRISVATLGFVGDS